MDRSIGVHLPFLQLLCTTDKKQRKALLQTITDAQLRAICELVLNIYRGTFNVPSIYVRKLAPHRKLIETLVDRAINKKHKKQLLSQKRNILPLMIGPYVRLSKKKNDGTRVSVDTSGPIRSTVSQT